MIKQQPQIRVIDPESEHFGDTFTVQEISYQYSQVLPCKGAMIFDFNQIQELTPLSHDGVRIGVGDKVVYEGANNTFNVTVVDWYRHAGSPGRPWLVLADGDHRNEEDITDHTPLKEMKKEENKRDYLESTGNEELAELALGEDNDKPTIERIDRPDPYDRHSDNMVSLDVPEVAAVLIEMFDQQTQILEALADAGLINFREN